MHGGVTYTNVRRIPLNVKQVFSILNSIGIIANKKEDGDKNNDNKRTK